MEKLKCLFIPFILLYSFAAFSQNQLKIVSPNKNQQVSGNLVVKLDTLNIKDYFGSLYSNDGHEVGNEFNIYWGRNHRELWGARVQIQSLNKQIMRKKKHIYEKGQEMQWGKPIVGG